MKFVYFRDFFNNTSRAIINKGTPFKIQNLNSNQIKYIHGESSSPITGSIIIMNMKKYKAVLIAFVDNSTGQIIHAHLRRGNMTMYYYVHFIKDLFKIQGNVLLKLGDSGNHQHEYWKYKVLRFYKIKTPQSFNRDWFSQMLSEWGITFHSYTWKDQSIPRIIKDFHKFFNATLYKIPEYLVNGEKVGLIIQEFNFRATQTIKLLANESEPISSDNWEEISKNKMAKLEKADIEELKYDFNNEKPFTDSELGLTKKLGKADSDLSDDEYYNSEPVNMELDNSSIKELHSPENSESKVNLDNSTPQVESSKESEDHNNTPKINKNPLRRVGYRKVKPISTRSFHTTSQLKSSEPKIGVWGKGSVKVKIKDNIRLHDHLALVIEAFNDKLETATKGLELERVKSLRFRVQLLGSIKGSTYRSITTMDTINPTPDSMNYLDESYGANLVRFEDHYNCTDLEELLITYTRVPDNYPIKHTSYISATTVNKNFSSLKISRALPKSYDFKSWGDYQKISDNHYQIRTKYYSITIVPTPEANHLTINYKDVPPSRACTDKDFGDNPGTFTREFPGLKIKYVNGEEVEREQEIPKKGAGIPGIKFITQLKPKERLIKDKDGNVVDYKPKIKIITMDIETRVGENNLMVPVCISWTTGDNEVSTLTIDYFKGDAERMIRSFFKKILVGQYHGWKLYVHNFAKFDGVFILKTLAKLPVKVVPIMRKSKIICIKLYYGYKAKDSSGNKEYLYSMTFFDSFHLLPLSLEKLGKAFCDDASLTKAMFPLKLLDEYPNLDYKGAVPHLKYFFKPDPFNKKGYEGFLSKYSEYSASFKGQVWNLKKELIKYCERDVRVLRSVIVKFINEIWDRFTVEITNSPTLPSIAFSIYRTFSIPKDSIPHIRGEIYNDIQNSYYGGIVDVYGPHVREVFTAYDVNSLYPYVMSECQMPVGAPTFIIGEKLDLSSIFGFVYAEIEAPNIHIPILPYRRPGKITVFPTGKWTGWYFSEELKNAEKYGYKIKVLKGWKFRGTNLFSIYVSGLYDIKLKSVPGTAWYIISKLLLNSLYGRFGMSPTKTSSEFLDKESFESLYLEEDTVIEDTIDMNDGNIWVTYFRNSILPSRTEANEMSNISVPISSAIAAWARIEMTKYLCKYSDKIDYVDTDGIKMRGKLPPEMVGGDLGQMKDEGTYLEGVFVAPKVYGLVNLDESVVKVKGLKKAISYWSLKNTIYGSSFPVEQEKWIRRYNESTIEVKPQPYTVGSTENKRKFIRDSSGVIVGSRPYMIINGKISEFIDEYLSPSILYYLPKYLYCVLYDRAHANAAHVLYNMVYRFYLKMLCWPVPVPINLPKIIEVRSYLPLTGTLSILGYVKEDVIYLPCPAVIEYPVIYLPGPIAKSSTISIIVRNLKSGEVTQYPSLIAASKALNISKSIISKRINGKILSPYKKMYTFSKS